MSAVKYRRCIIKFYNKTAVIRDHNSFEKIIALLEGIDQYHFDLTLNSSLLNTWPNSTLLLAGYWTPALKNNPLDNNNPKIAEAVDAIYTDEGIMINGQNRTDKSYNSSLSSSFVDTEFFPKQPVTIMDEDTGWNLIIKQSSNSTSTSNETNYNDFVDKLKKDNSNNEIIVIEPTEQEIVFSIDEEESKFGILNTKPKTEITPSSETMKEALSFNELLESYNLKIKSSLNRFKNEDTLKQLTVPKIIEERYYNNSGDVSIKIVENIQNECLKCIM